MRIAPPPAFSLPFTHFPMRLSAFAATSPIAPSFARLLHAFATLGLACALGYGVLATPAAAQDSDSNDTALMNLIAQASERVMLADTVARYKWAHRQAVADPAREQALLVTVAQQAPRYDVKPQLAQTFFRDQIEANKLVQQALIDGWRVAPPPPGPVASSRRKSAGRAPGNPRL